MRLIRLSHRISAFIVTVETGLCAFLFALAWAGTSVAALPVQLADGEPLPTLAPMLERTTPAVVNIATFTTVQVTNPLLADPFFRRFFNVPRNRSYRRTQAAGSGVVVDAKRGYIVTNNHVVQRADEISITLADGRTLQATLVGSDAQVDLAVLQVDADSLSEIVFADSSDLRVGDFVVAIGNPFGLSQTVTSGIVSALGRSGLGIEGYEDFIQTDASINPGNSGGALVDLRGELVGINTAIFAPSGGNVGIGFAIPANLVRVIMDQLIEHGQVRRGYLGLSVQALNPKLAEAFDVKSRRGVIVVDVEPGSAAEAAGLESGDIIVRIEDKQISKVADFQSQAAMIFVDDKVVMEVLRNGRARRFKLELGEDKLENVPGERIDPRLAGTKLQNFRNTEETAMGAGVLVTAVSAKSLAKQSGLRAGDIIVEANRVAVGNLTDLRDGSRRSARQILLRIYRSGQFGNVVIR